MTDTVQGAFSNENETIINWKGENFYRACDAFVMNKPGGGESHCVKPVYHSGDLHVDWDGCERLENSVQDECAKEGAVIINECAPPPLEHTCTFAVTTDNIADLDFVMETLKGSAMAMMFRGISYSLNQFDYPAGSMDQ